MEAFTEPLMAAVQATTFEFERSEVDAKGGHFRSSRERGVSASKIREIYLRERGRTVNFRVRATVPDDSLRRVEDAVRRILQQFIDQDTDRIGHAFPCSGMGGQDQIEGIRVHGDGLADEQFSSPVSDFAHGVVRASGLLGVAKIVELLNGWKQGAPVTISMSTVLNGLLLAAPVEPREGVRLVPLPMETSALPRLPVDRKTVPQDYLGLTLLTVRVQAKPALFRPYPDGPDYVVECCSVDGVNLGTVCQSLSLQTGRHVSKSSIWYDYGDAAAFRLGDRGTWCLGEDRLKPLSADWNSIDGLVFTPPTGVGTITLKDDVVPQRLDPQELLEIIECLSSADRELRIAVDRWHRSSLSGTGLENRFIDLRIALEALYLKDFPNERNQEMRFRLSLMGAWHLSESLEERRSIRKALTAAYDRASRAVHAGEVPDEAEKELVMAQDLCRRGILKLIREGAPSNWGDLVLGAGRIP